MEPNIDDIALFPLNVFLLPSETTILYIFEDRYKQLIHDCEAGVIAGFGIMYKSPINTKSYGSYVELDEVLHRHPDGEMDIRVRALSIFSVQEFASRKEGKLYPGGRITKKPLFDQAATVSLTLAWREFMINTGQEDEEVLEGRRVSVLRIAATLGFNEPEKLEILDLGSRRERERYIFNYFRFLEFIYDQEEYTFRGIYLN